MKRAVTLIIVFSLLVFFVSFFFTTKHEKTITAIMPTTLPKQIEKEERHPMAIESLRQRDYPASTFTIEETLSPGSNYTQYIASYTSDGNKIYGLLTIPNTPRPGTGYPFIMFLHGYIPPAQYETTAGYNASQDGLARSEFVTYKPDLRGHGRSEGDATGAHFSEAYLVDTLNAMSAIKAYQQNNAPLINPEKIGMWGHSNGGQMTLRLMVISDEIQAGVIWAGVIGSFEAMLETYNSKIPFLNRRTPPLVYQYGLPSENPAFWSQLDPYSYLSEISGPVQIHHGTADYEVPIELSQQLQQALENEGKSVEYYEYQGADHNFSGSASSTVMQRTVAFFREHL